MIAASAPLASVHLPAAARVAGLVQSVPHVARTPRPVGRCPISDVVFHMTSMCAASGADH